MLLLQHAAFSLHILVIRIFAITTATRTQATLQRLGGLPAGGANTKGLMSLKNLSRVAVVSVAGEVDDFDDKLLGCGSRHLLLDACLPQERQDIA